MDDSLCAQAQVILSTLAADSSTAHGYGSLSISVYDTAWLAMIWKPAQEGSSEPGAWLFPCCFQYLLAQQLPSGAWESYATPVDGILNTGAALLAIKQHLRRDTGHQDWLLRSQKAEEALRHLLYGWDIRLADQVGFEVLVPSLLEALGQEGVAIDFPQLDVLRAIRDTKLAKLPPSILYKTPSTLLHSLEAFVGHIDFNKVSQWRNADGSMMGSPASTAAYLMNVSAWDVQAEEYLINVVGRFKGGESHGGVPCAWPTTVFEISWAVTTLASAGIPVPEKEAQVVCMILENMLTAQNGLLGFAAGLLPDADDTAKGLEALWHLGRFISVDSLTGAYEATDHFITYPGERNPSFSANCNILTLLLTRSDRDKHLPQIAKATRFLANNIFNGNVKDKWHLNTLYWMHLFSHALNLLFEHPELALGVLDLFPTLTEEIPMISLHILTHLLREQKPDGSWDNVCEVTAYGVLALTSLLRLPWMQHLDEKRVVEAITLGKSFLNTHRSKWATGHYLWVEKVTYGSGLLSQVYCIAAASIGIPSRAQEEVAASLRAHVCIEPRTLTGMRKTGELVAHTPLFLATDAWVLRAAEVQACFAKKMLERTPIQVFPRTAKGKDKYLFLIPLALTACAQLLNTSTSLSLSVLREMMVLSILNFHADEYMEGVVEKHYVDDLNVVRGIVGKIFAGNEDTTCSDTVDGFVGQQSTTLSLNGDACHTPQNGHCTQAVSSSVHGDEELHGKPRPEDIATVLQNFATKILRHPAVLSRSSPLQAQLASDLETFLLAHITQADDNQRFRRQWATQSATNGRAQQEAESNSPDKQPNPRLVKQYLHPGRTFYSWVRSTSADHTSCPFSFVFFNCLVEFDGLGSTGCKSQGSHFLTSARTAYLAEDACRHLASLCRMYNDIGSLARDAEEVSLNSVNFPEFSFKGSGAELAMTTKFSARTELLWVAEYERHGLNIALQQLEAVLGSAGGQLMDTLRMFVNVTDLYGQIYLLKDVGTRTS